MRAYALTVEGYGTNVTIKGQTKIISILYNKWLEFGQAKTITHMADLQNLFPDIEINNL